jgi:hypothetical protein
MNSIDIHNLNRLTVPKLKNLNKLINNKNSDGKRKKKIEPIKKKEQIIEKICKYVSCLKIQRMIRKKMALEQICPISMDVVIYPCFAFKPKGNNKFIYYNLGSLVNYLLTTGDFRDPKTREEYSDSVIMSIDKEVVKNNIPLQNPFKSVLKASKNKKYYIKKKDIEDTILVLERCLDDIIGSMRSVLEQQVRRNPMQTLNSLFFMAFRTYFKRLVSVSIESASSLISRTIITINNTIKDNEDVNGDTNQIRDNIIQFLYQIQFDELGE